MLFTYFHRWKYNIPEFDLIYFAIDFWNFVDKNPHAYYNYKKEFETKPNTARSKKTNNKELVEFKGAPKSLLEYSTKQFPLQLLAMEKQTLMTERAIIEQRK